MSQVDLKNWGTVFVSLLATFVVGGHPLASHAQLRESVPDIISGYATTFTADGIGFQKSSTFMRVRSSGKSFDFEIEAGSHHRSGYINLVRAVAHANDASLMRSAQLPNASYHVQTFTSDPGLVSRTQTTGNINVLVLVWPSASNIVSAAELEDRLNGAGSDSVVSYITNSSQGRATMKFTIRYLQGDGPKCFDLNESQEALNRAQTQEPSLDARSFQTVATLYSQNSCNNLAGGMAGLPTQFESKQGAVDMSQFAMVLLSDVNSFQYLFRHELGHTLGLGHASTESCANGDFDSGCVNWNYGDPTNVMGYSLVTLNYQDYQRWQMGWLDTVGVLHRGQLQIGPDLGTQIGLIEIRSPYRFVRDIAKPWLIVERQYPISARRPKLVLKLASSSNIGTVNLHDRSRAEGTELLELHEIGEVIELPGMGLRLELIVNTEGSSTISVTHLAQPAPIFAGVVASNASAQSLVDGKCTDRTLSFNGNWPNAQVRFVDYSPARFEGAIHATTAMSNGHFQARMNSADPTVHGVFAVSTSASPVREYYESLPYACSERPLAATIEVIPAPYSASQSCQNTVVNMNVTGLSGYTPFFGNVLLSATPGNYVQSILRDTRLPFVATLLVVRPVEIVVLGRVYDPPRYCPSAGPIPTLSVNANWNKKCTMVSVNYGTGNAVTADPVYLDLYKRTPTLVVEAQANAPQSPSGYFSLPFTGNGPALLEASWNGQVRKLYLDECQP